MTSNALFFHGLGELYTRPPNWKVQARYLKGFDRMVRNRQGDPRKILERHGIDPLCLDDPDHYIECSSVANLLEYCREFFCDPLFGLRLAEMQSPDVFGCVTTLARSAPTLREGLESFIDYLPVIHCRQRSDIEILTGKSAAEIRWRQQVSVGDNDQAVYHGFLLVKKLLTALIGHGHISYANLTFPTGRTLDAAQDIIGCRVQGKSAINAIGFSTELLDRPIESSNKLLFTLLGGFLEQVRTSTPATLVEQIESYVRNTPPFGKCTVGGCAKELGISARTLQKRLAQMDLKFSDVTESQRVKLAEQALCHSNRSLDEIAGYFGYSEQSSFGRAFKRWTGLTPQAYRTQHQARTRPQ
jgi:AraC-like DNA-binding protein